MLIAAREKSLVKKLKAQLSSHFDMKDLGPAKKILGMEINRDCQAGKLFLSQKKYVLKMLDKFGMRDCKAVNTPIAAHFKLSSINVQNQTRTKGACHMSRIQMQLEVSCML